MLAGEGCNCIISVYITSNETRVRNCNVNFQSFWHLREACKLIIWQNDQRADIGYSTWQPSDRPENLRQQLVLVALSLQKGVCYDRKGIACHISGITSR